MKKPSIMKRLWFVLISSTWLIASAHAAPQKEAWEWTVEDRLASRFDVAKIHERNLAYETSHPQARGSEQTKVQSTARPTKEPLVYRIDGTRNPELFLSYELFDALLTGLSPDQALREKQRRYYLPSIRGLGYEDEIFWENLQSVVAQYLPLRFTEHQVMSQENRAAEDTMKCRERFAALEASRRLFGHREFEMILYTVIAPTMQYSEATLDDSPSTRHLRAERGCQ